MKSTPHLITRDHDPRRADQCNLHTHVIANNNNKSPIQKTRAFRSRKSVRANKVPQPGKVRGHTATRFERMLQLAVPQESCLTEQMRHTVSFKVRRRSTSCGSCIACSRTDCGAYPLSEPSLLGTASGPLMLSLAWSCLAQDAA